MTSPNSRPSTHTTEAPHQQGPAVHPQEVDLVEVGQDEAGLAAGMAGASAACPPSGGCAAARPRSGEPDTATHAAARANGAAPPARVRSRFKPWMPFMSPLRSTELGRRPPGPGRKPSLGRQMARLVRANREPVGSAIPPVRKIRMPSSTDRSG